MDSNPDETKYGNFNIKIITPQKDRPRCSSAGGSESTKNDSQSMLPIRPNSGLNYVRSKMLLACPNTSQPFLTKPV
jgi:hypothetical protein